MHEYVESARRRYGVRRRTQLVLRAVRDGHLGLGQVQDFCAVAATIKDSQALAGLMAEITRAMGFRYFALVHHIDLKPAVSSVHIVDYPPEWVERFQARRLYASDPIHRASHRTNIGFAWSAVQSLITLSAADGAVRANALNRNSCWAEDMDASSTQTC